MNKTVKFVVMAAFLLLAAVPASADNQGGSGRVAGFALNAAESDVAGTVRGKVVVDTAGVLQPYHWDGVVCPTQGLSEAEEALLAGLVGNKKVLVTPYWQAGQGGIRCLVSFVVGDKKSLPNIPQFP